MLRNKGRKRKPQTRNSIFRWDQIKIIPKGSGHRILFNGDVHFVVRKIHAVNVKASILLLVNHWGIVNHNSEYCIKEFNMYRWCFERNDNKQKHLMKLISI